ncbi:MAG TPA: beta-propeller fold lactonase family protein [Jatrophihabitantaceae bacterium]|jgi:6-phosphogluconolactonase
MSRAPVTAIVVASEGPDGGAVIVFDPATWEPRHETDGMAGALALAAHPSGRALYVADGVGELVSLGGPGWDVLGRQPSGGNLPCALNVDPSGRFVVTANYLSADLAVHPIGADLTLGALVAERHHEGSGPVAGRQDTAHLHHVAFDPAHGTAVVTDLGGDRLYEYAIDVEGRPDVVDEVATPSGSGPRHSVFGANGELFVSGELSSTLSRYRRDDTGRLRWIEAVPTRETDDGTENYPSELVLGPGVVYLANRGRDTIAVIDVTGPRLELVQEQPCGGAFPQHLAVLGDQLLCANRQSDTITALPIDDTARLGAPVAVAEVTGPCWILPLCA